MAFESNNAVEFKKYVGVNKVKVIALNPTLEELNKLGIMFKTEPVYFGKDDNGVDFIDFVFWTESINDASLKTSIKFTVKNEASVSSKTGKTEYINKLGQNQWVEGSAQNTQYFDASAGAKPAFVGETDLITFMKNWLNVKRGGEATIDLAKAFKDGNISELKSITSNNGIWVMFTVSQGKYQNILSKFIVRGFVSEEDAKGHFDKYAKKQSEAGYPIYGDYSINFKEWSEEAPDEDKNFKEDPDNELPF